MASCVFCSRYRHNTQNDRGRPTCDAFPDGIPWQIASGEVFHDEPFEGDHGLQYDEEPYIEEED